MKKLFSLALLFCLLITGSFAQNQDFPEILDEIEIIPVMVNGDNNNRINIVFLNQWRKDSPDAYNKPEMREEYLKDIEESLIAGLTYGHEDAHTAFAHYKEFFNVYAMWWPTAPAWVNKEGQPKVEYLIREHFLPWKDEYTGWATMLIMQNTINGGGGAGRDLEMRKGSAVIAGNSINEMLHEISHTCMSIGDEYTTHATGTAQVPTYSVSQDYTRDGIKWRKWIDPETPIPTPYTKEYANKVGAFEGTQYHLVDYFRNSAQGCIMGSGVFDCTSKMCVTCNQRVVMRVNALVDIINSTTPSNKEISINGTSSMKFAVDHIKPYPNSQVVRWYLNDQLLEKEMNKDEITVNFGDLKSYKLVCEITDESEFIRPDPPYAAYPVREVVWNITNTDSKAQSEELAVSIKDSKNTLTATVKGGKAPYTYMWDGKCCNTATIKDAAPGIYNVTVVDSEFKTGSARYVIYDDSKIAKATSKNGSKLSPSINIFAAEKGKPSGKVSITAPEGCEYTYLWGDEKSIYGKQIIYEAEDCITTMEKEVKSYWTANGYEYLTFNGKEGSVSFDIEVARAGVYPIEIIYAPIKPNPDPNVIVYANTKDNQQKVLFVNTRPLNTGWDTAKPYLKLNKGKNRITIESTGQSLPNLDYIRVADSYVGEPITSPNRRLLTPGKYSVAISDKAGNTLVEEIVVGEEAPFMIEKMEIVANGKNGVKVKNPVSGYTYQWYATDTPLLYAEVTDAPLAVGTDFYPTEPGNYYMSARKNQTNMESSNRIGFLVSKKGTAAKATPISPDKFKAEERLMWYDASDLDADGVTDFNFQDRGPTKMWKEKGEIIGKQGNINANYYPNALNGMAVGGWDKEWVSNSGKSVVGYQTIIMLYKESDMSFAGTAPFRGSMYYMGKAQDSNKALFGPSTKRGRTFLNGRQVNVLLKANPMDYCTLTVELNEPGMENSSTTEGYWEGNVAEIMMFNRKLTDEERMGVEEYLRLKWLTGIELEF